MTRKLVEHSSGWTASTTPATGRLPAASNSSSDADHTNAQTASPPRTGGPLLPVARGHESEPPRPRARHATADRGRVLRLHSLPDVVAQRWPRRLPVLGTVDHRLGNHVRFRRLRPARA